MPVDPRRVEAVFLGASELPEVDRPAYLDAACGADADLRAAVEKLLAAHANPASIFNPHPAPGVPLTETGPYALHWDAGTVLADRYKLIERIGEGGMGEVWMADQTTPVRRRVAVKLIKSGMDSRAVLARFEAERQALALMDHPNIARVLDGGVTADGRPFFVMELVKGVPITRFCDDRRLAPRERLELFVPVCQAVQHAHQKGIIHRDIKPKNVLVALYDDRPTPKVIDFGVAKATGQPLTEHTLVTGFGAVVGTLEYMSPEQATFNNLDVDTRSDLYSLGVLLYELLTGSTPFTKKGLEAAGLLEILRAIREVEPPRPSKKLSTADALPTLAANRRTDPRELTGLLRNELDWIVMKALEKDRSRRYDSATGFAADVQRYLSGEAVSAHPPTTAYRVKKFVRRNRGRVLAAGLVLFVLLTGMAGTTWGLIRAEEQRRAAEGAVEAERLARRDAVTKRDEAERQQFRAEAGEKLAGDRLVQVAAERDAKDVARQDAEAIARFLGEVFQSPDPSRDGRTITVAETIDRAAKKLAADPAITPARRAALQATLGRTYHALGLYPQAIAIQESVREFHRTTSGPEHPNTLRAMIDLAAAHRETGNTAESSRLLLEAVPLLRKVNGPEHPDTLRALTDFARTRKAARHALDAYTVMKEVVPLYRKVYGPEHAETLRVMFDLANYSHSNTHPVVAQKLLEEVGPLLRKVCGLEHPDTLRATFILAMVYANTGPQERGLMMLEELLPLYRKVFGPEHNETLQMTHGMGYAYYLAGRPGDGIRLFEELLPLYRKVRGPEHTDTIVTMSRLVTFYEDAGKIEQALSLKRELMTLARKLLQPKDPERLSLMAALGRLLLRANAFDEAEPLLRECLSVHEKAKPDAWQTFDTQSLLGGALLGQKEFAEAEPLLLAGYEGLRQREKTLPRREKPDAKKDVAYIADTIDRLIELYTATNQPDAVKKWRAEAAKYPALAPPPREK